MLFHHGVSLLTLATHGDHVACLTFHPQFSASVSCLTGQAPISLSSLLLSGSGLGPFPVGQKLPGCFLQPLCVCSRFFGSLSSCTLLPGKSFLLDAALGS